MGTEKDIITEKAVMEKAMMEEILIEEAAEEKLYTLRPLQDEDLYSVLAILGAIIPDDFKETFVQLVSGEESLDYKGKLVAFDMGRLILKNFKTVKNEMYEFLSDLSGIPAANIKKLPFGTTPQMVMEVFEDVKNASFFKDVFKLF